MVVRLIGIFVPSNFHGKRKIGLKKKFCSLHNWFDCLMVDSMTHFEASLVADYLNRRFSGPSGAFCTYSAFSDCRTNEVDSNGFWKYYVCSPNGAFRSDGSRLTFNEELEAIRLAEIDVLCEREDR